MNNHYDSHYSNCVLSALICWLFHPKSTKIKFARNRAGRWHCFWERLGLRYEFYAPGRSKLGYLQNLLYQGRVVCVGHVWPECMESEARSLWGQFQSDAAKEAATRGEEETQALDEYIAHVYCDLLRELAPGE